ncbi:MAG: hypothetical protein JWM16_2831, partial [Verrucomicrobiales bacterium]|nr:hypothetical protein [Verrucomicrobiales bacterium]
MKALIAILVVVGVIFGGWKLWDYWDTVDQQKDAAQKVPDVTEDQMGRMTPELENTLQEARKKGASGVKDWLNKYQKSPKIPEARLVWIKLDYVLMASQSDPLEAKKVFADVKEKTPA